MVAGSQLAQASADVIFTGDDLRTLARFPALAAQTRRVVRQNLSWAAAYNLTVIPLAAFGVLMPWMAALGMSLSSLMVVANALALRETDPVVAVALISPILTPIWMFRPCLVKALRASLATRASWGPPRGRSLARFRSMRSLQAAESPREHSFRADPAGYRAARSRGLGVLLGRSIRAIR